MSADSAFFQVFPPEIRRRILVEAFGDRTVHVQRCSREDSNNPRYLFWLCNRPVDANPSMVHCIEYSSTGGTWVSRGWSDANRKFMGVEGWLLSCQQAYIEAIEVIYVTNTLHVRGWGVDEGPARLLPPQHLAGVRSLEWISDALAYRDVVPGYGLTLRKGELQEVLPLLPQQLPTLQKLYVGLRWPISPSTHFPSWDELIADCESLAVMFDSLVLSFKGRLKEMELGLPSELFLAHFRAALTQPDRVLKVEDPIWRPGLFTSECDRGEDSDVVPTAQVRGTPAPRQRIWRPAEGADPQRGGSVGGDHSSKQLGYWIGVADDLMPPSWLLRMHRIWTVTQGTLE